MRTFSILGGYLGSLSLFSVRLFDVLAGCLSLISLSLDQALEGGDVSRGWSVWSSAAEAALADACQFAGGSVPVGVWSWVGVLFWHVLLV